MINKLTASFALKHIAFLESWGCILLSSLLSLLNVSHFSVTAVLLELQLDGVLDW